MSDPNDYFNNPLNAPEIKTVSSVSDNTIDVYINGIKQSYPNPFLQSKNKADTNPYLQYFEPSNYINPGTAIEKGTLCPLCKCELQAGDQVYELATKNVRNSDPNNSSSHLVVEPGVTVFAHISCPNKPNLWGNANK